MPDGSSTAHLFRPKLVTVKAEGYGVASLRKESVRRAKLPCVVWGRGLYCPWQVSPRVHLQCGDNRCHGRALPMIQNSYGRQLPALRSRRERGNPAGSAPRRDHLARI